jgi:hypothetical protein
MSDSPLTLKQSTGFFAAGREMAEALALLSDGAFKLYAYVCLYADRHTAQLCFRVAALALATGHSTRSLTTYLEEVRRQQVGLVHPASNQHESGCIEICDRFWPYQKQAPVSMEDPEQALYVGRVRSWFLERACVVSVFSSADQKLAVQWYRDGRVADQVHRAILMGCARKYMALFNNSGGSLITALQYFSGILEEVASTEVSLDYWRYLAVKVEKLDHQWRAQANFAGPTRAQEPNTN